MTRALIASLIALDPAQARTRLDRMVARIQAKGSRTWDFGHGMTEAGIAKKDLQTTIHLAPGVIIKTHMAELDMAVWRSVPDSVQIAMVGRRLSDLLGHPALTCEIVRAAHVPAEDYLKVRLDLDDVWITMVQAHAMIDDAQKENGDG